MKLKLERPIAFLDTETTGTDVEKDRIVELSIVKLMPDGTRQAATRRFNPGIPIPKEAADVHGITDEMIANEAPFSARAKGLHDWIQGCDIGTYNGNRFDLPLLYNEFLRAGIDWNYSAHFMIDVSNIFKIREERTLSAAVMFYCGKPLEGAHGAEADTQATIDVFLEQLDLYGDLPEKIEELALYSNYGKHILDISGKFTCNDKGEIILNFGKHRGQLASDKLNYINWMMEGDFLPDTKRICQSILNRQ